MKKVFWSTMLGIGIGVVLRNWWEREGMSVLERCHERMEGMGCCPSAENGKKTLEPEPEQTEISEPLETSL